MKIMVASDLHLEHRNGLMDVLPQHALFQQPDVLILAGDIHCHLGLKDTLTDICELFPDTLILYTTGNHEYYSRRYTMDEIDVTIRIIEGDLNNQGYNFRFLNNDSFSYQGIHFYGGCMWSDLHHKYPTIANTDSVMVRTDDGGLNEDDVRGLWLKFKYGLDNHIEKYGSENTVVVSHFSPSIDFGNPLIDNDGSFIEYYFSASMDTYLNDMSLKAWFYGHTHYSQQHTMECSGCLVASCQGGYPHENGIIHEPKPFTIFEV